MGLPLPQQVCHHPLLLRGFVKTRWDRAMGRLMEARLLGAPAMGERHQERRRLTVLSHPQPALRAGSGLVAWHANPSHMGEDHTLNTTLPDTTRQTGALLTTVVPTVHSSN